MSSMFTFRVLGVSQLIASLRRVEERKVDAAVRGLNQVGLEVFSESQRRVPVDTGNLRSSGRIEQARLTAPRVTLSYGGTASAYAIIVHETHRTKSKFLEAPAREAATRFRDVVAAEIRRT